MAYHWSFGFLWASAPLLWQGLMNTLWLALICSVCGLLIGLFAALLLLSRWHVARLLATGYTELFRNVPGIVQIFWFYFTIPVLTGWQSSPFLAASVSLSLYSGAFCAEIYRAGILSVDPGQWAAANALGFGRLYTMRDVILPQAMQRMLPAFTNRIMEVVKTTTLASTISFAELLYNAKLAAEDQLRPLEAYTAVAVIFTLILLPLSYAATRLERRMARGLNR